MTEREGQLPVFLYPGFMLVEKKKTINITFLGQEVLDTAPHPPPFSLARHLPGLDSAGGRQGRRLILEAAFL